MLYTICQETRKTTTSPYAKKQGKLLLIHMTPGEKLNGELGLLAVMKCSDDLACRKMGKNSSQLLYYS